MRIRFEYSCIAEKPGILWMPGGWLRWRGDLCRGIIWCIIVLNMTDQRTLTEILFSEEASSLQGAMKTLRLADGEVLFNRGDPGDAFYVIDSGQVRIFTLDEGGQEITLNTLGAGEGFGELSLLDDRPRSASAAAVGPTTLRRLHRGDFLERVHTSPALTDTAIRLLSERARHMTDYIERLGLWARLVAEGNYNQAMESIRDTGDTSDRALAAVADAVERMVRAVKEREEQLRQEVAQLRIEIDEAKRKRQVEEITETDYFQQLSRQARNLRERSDT
jgi:CRP-like cAMP-binding protein